MQSSDDLSTYKGRIPRSTYWLYTLGISVMLIVVSIMDLIFGFVDKNSGIGILSFLLMIFLAIPSWRVCLKRCHDRNHSGAYLLILGMIPIFGFLWLSIELGFLRGTVGNNRFGPDPTIKNLVAST